MSCSSFTAVPNSILKNTSLSLSQRMVAMILLSFAWEDKIECWPSLETISAETGLSKGRCSTIITELEQKGLVQRARKFGRQLVYRLLFKKQSLTSDSFVSRTIPQKIVSSAEPNKTNLEEEKKTTTTAPPDPVPIKPPKQTDCGGGSFSKIESRGGDHTALDIPSSLQAIKKTVLKMVNGIPEQDAQEILTETAAQIEQHAQQNDPIRNVGGYLARIVQRWRQGLFTSALAAKRQEQQERENLAEKQRQAEAEKKRQQETEAEQHRELLKTAFSNLDKNEVTVWKKRFIEHLHRDNPFMHSIHKDKNFKSKHFDMQFRQFVGEELGVVPRIALQNAR